EDNGFGLMVLQKRLPFGVQLDIGPVVVEEVELDALGTGTRQKVVVHVPVIRTNHVWIGMSRGVDGLHCLGLEKRTDGLLGFPGCSFALAAHLAAITTGMGLLR